MQATRIGRIVHFVLGKHGDTPVIRPAIIVQVHSSTYVNLQVFTDGDNDDAYLRPSERTGRDGNIAKAARCIVWRTSVIQCSADAPIFGCWFWPPRDDV